MTFGVILLCLIAAISVLGSLIPQNQDAMTYVNQYPDYYGLILKTGLDHVFTTWYFLALSGLLCLNLIFCSIVRFRSIAAAKTDPEKAAAVPAKVKLDEEGIRKVRHALAKERCAMTEVPSKGTVYTKNRFGRFGTFITHLGILLTVVFWAAAMYLPKITDQTCYPKESIRLDDGTEIYVDSFSIETDAKLDYKSVINIRLPDGRETGLKEVSVNHPVSLGQYKVYQQTYGTIGYVTARSTDGKTDHFYLETNDFLSGDGKNGILFDNFVEQNGQMQVVTSTTGSYKNPVYVYTVVEDGMQKEIMLAFPGDVQEIGEYEIKFEKPVEYPGLRIKKTPAFVNISLLIAFLIMTAGLYITFFVQPVTVTVNEEGYTILGGRNERMEIILKDAVNEIQ